MVGNRKDCKENIHAKRHSVEFYGQGDYGVGRNGAYGSDVKENEFSECASRSRIAGSRVESWVCAGAVDRAVSDQRVVRSKSL